MTIPLTVLALLVGCGKDDTGDTALAADTDADTDADADTDTDTDTDADTDTNVSGFNLEITLAGTPGPNWYAGAYVAHLDAKGSMELYGAVAATPMTSSTVTLNIPEPTGDEVGPLWDTESGALYFIYAFDDANGGGQHVNGETIVAISRAMPAFVTGKGSWTGLEVIDFDSDFVDIDPAEGVTLNPVDAQPVELNATSNLKSIPIGSRVGAISMFEFKGLLPGRPIDEEATNPWTSTLVDPLEPKRMGYIDALPNIRVGQEIVGVLIDADLSADISLSDIPIGEICFDDHLVFLYYLDPFVDTLTAMFVDVHGLRAGWNTVIETNKGTVVLTEKDNLQLTMEYSAKCAGL